jgi:lipoate-protein ligase A
MTGKLFGSLLVHRDLDSRSAALNMAVDEALLETATEPTIRFYRWNRLALSFGYFGKFADVASYERDIVRRWTGGGIVFHGNDLTYSLVIPANDRVSVETSMSIYEKTHSAICRALAATRKGAFQFAPALETRHSLKSAIGNRSFNECFANPAPADVVWNGRKIAGAAQRRTRRGLLQQGSIQNVNLSREFEKNFAAQLSESQTDRTIDQKVLERATELATERYVTIAWLRRR